MTQKKPILSKLNFFYWKQVKRDKFSKKFSIARTLKGDVEYFLEGEKGSVIAAIHGEPGNIFQCGYIFAGLRSPSFRYLSWSRPGYLGTPLSSGKTINDQTELLCALLDYLNIDRVVLAGFSFGGLIAMDFAVRFPERVYALILEGSVAERIPYGMSFIRRLFNFFAFSDIGNYCSDLFSFFSEKIAIRAFIGHYSKFNSKQIEYLVEKLQNDKDLFEIIRNNLIDSLMPFSINKEGFLNDAREYSYFQNLQPKKIKSPTLLIHGREDAEVSLEHGIKLSEAIPFSETLFLDNACHFTLLTNEKEVMKAKFSFISKHALPVLKSRQYYSENEKLFFAQIEKIADSDESVLLVDSLEIYRIGESYQIELSIEVSSRAESDEIKIVSERLKAKIRNAVPQAVEILIETLPSGYFASTIK
ncbi:MAG TPA: hypothetical protein DD381_01955 [Lentisphaeria bacterium]|nr:MAG: hypothetical protein A2X47_12635 [Lentisphaerae bacterium GWF2_38_69]HBM15104.1 hypothetical protein [Lentisphaeria bacterium]